MIASVDEDSGAAADSTVAADSGDGVRVTAGVHDASNKKIKQ
jgi:hypothetical protein